MSSCRVWMVLGVALSGCTLFATQGEQSQSQNVSLVYGFKTVTEPELQAMVDGLRQGTLTVDSTEFGEVAVCAAVDSTTMDLELYYDDFQRIDNGRLSAGALQVKQHGPHSPALQCPIPSTPPALDIQTDRGLTLGGADTSGSAKIRIDGVDYAADSQLYYRFRLLTRDANSGFTTGSFAFVGRNVSDPTDLRVVVVRDGVFGSIAQ